MSSLAVGLALALLASLALNGSYLLQHVGGRAAPAVAPRHPLRTLRGLLGSRTWAAGLGVGLLGWALHVGALAHAPLSLVQAFGAGGLALAVPAGTRLLRERLSRGELAAVGLMVAALVLLAAGAQAPGVASAVPAGALVVYLAVAACAAAVLAARRPAPPLLGAAAGILYGAADAATKAATVAAGHGGTPVAVAWVAAVLPLSAGAFLCFQRGLQSGAAVPVVALMTAATNAVATLGGVLVLGDPLGRGPASALAHLLALVAIGVGAWRLAPTQARLTVAAR
ncbi:MAG TPA: hypothetical protein VFF79_17340 [Conexibacter sp.]|nr:hypothetical protein [Conexibacter sp.]